MELLPSFGMCRVVGLRGYVALNVLNFVGQPASGTVLTYILQDPIHAA